MGKLGQEQVYSGNTSPTWNTVDNGFQYGNQGPTMTASQLGQMSPQNRMALESSMGGPSMSEGGTGFGGGDMFGMMDSSSVGANGQQITNQGWGGMAMGLGQMYLNWTQGKAQQELGREQLDFSKEQFYKNYAMNMDKYRRRVNRESAGLAHAGTGGSWSDTAKRYNTGAAMLDENGATMADPTYGPVAASPAAVNAAQNSGFNSAAGMAPTVAGVSPTANALLNRGTGADSVGVDAESKRKSAPASEKDQYQGARESEAAAVESATKKKKKLS